MSLVEKLLKSTPAQATIEKLEALRIEVKGLREEVAKLRKSIEKLNKSIDRLSRTEMRPGTSRRPGRGEQD